MLFPDKITHSDDEIITTDNRYKYVLQNILESVASISS